MSEKKIKKSKYFKTFLSLVDEYPKVLVVNADNVGSAHLQSIRRDLREENAVVLMGKNTLMRKAIREHLSTHPKLEALLPSLVGNVGLVFTKGDLKRLKDKVAENKVSAPAKVGSISPVDVIVPKGDTGLEPTKTSFLQALHISSKINKGKIEIINDVELISVGQKVGQNEATLLQMLNIRPFSYGLRVESVYDDGNVYEPKILDISDEDIMARIRESITKIASISLGAGYPTLAAVPHLIANAYKNLLAVVATTDYVFPQAEQLKQMLENPDAFVVQTQTTTESAPAETAQDEDEEEEDFEGGVGGLFGDDDF